MMLTIIIAVIAYLGSGTYQSVLVGSAIGAAITTVSLVIGYRRRTARMITITNRDISFCYANGVDEWTLNDLCFVDASDYGTNTAPYTVISLHDRRGRRHRMPMLRDETETLITTILECAPSVVVMYATGLWMVPSRTVDDDGCRALRAMIRRQAVVLLWVTPLLAFFAAAGLAITGRTSPGQPVTIGRLAAFAFTGILIIGLLLRCAELGRDRWRVRRLQRGDHLTEE